MFWEILTWQTVTQSRTWHLPRWLHLSPPLAWHNSCLTSCSRSLLQILTCFCYLYKDLEVTRLVETSIQGCHNVEENARQEKLTFLLLIFLIIRGWGAEEEEVLTGRPQGHHQWVTQGEEPLRGHQGGQVQEVQQRGVRQAAVRPNGPKQVCIIIHDKKRLGLWWLWQLFPHLPAVSGPDRVSAQVPILVAPILRLLEDILRRCPPPPGPWGKEAREEGDVWKSWPLCPRHVWSDQITFKDYQQQPGMFCSN